MAALKPRRLPPGGTVAIIASSSPVYDGRRITRAAGALSRAGFQVVLGKHVHRRLGYLAGTPEERARDLHEAFANPSVDAVLELRGGYGAGDLLPLLDEARIAADPKPFVGSSDITLLHLAIRRLTGLVTFWGPMANQLPGASDYTWRHLRRALTEPGSLGAVEPAPGDPPVQTLVPGVAEGELAGGTTTLLAASLGTPWEVDTRGKVLILEDVDEEPYVIDRLLTQLIQSGKLQAAAGLVIAEHVGIRPRQHDPAFGGHTLGLGQILERLVTPLGVPAIHGLPLGHGRHLATVPLGTRARLDAGRGLLEIVEPALAA